MTPLFKKLNLGDARVVHVLDAPDSFEPEVRALDDVEVLRTIEGPVAFAIAFVKTKAAVAAAAAALGAAAQGDAVVWMAYPKGTSRKYTCEFNRDTGWQPLGDLGYEPVRQVAIDDDWSALRFRKADFIKTMTRNPAGAISSTGRRKAGERRQR